MTDELSRPLGQERKPRWRGALPRLVANSAAVAAGAVIVAGIAWTALTEDPLGGEPVAIVATHAPQPASAASDTTAAVTAAPPAAAIPASPAPPPGTQTVTIIDGSTGQRKQVIVGGNAPNPGVIMPADGAAAKHAADKNAANDTAKDAGIDAGAAETPPARPATSAAESGKASQSRLAAVDPGLFEDTPQGPVPAIGANGVRPMEAYAQPAPPGSGPRIAVVVGQLGISPAMLAEALAKLPPAVTLAVTPYGADLDRWVARARGAGHEVLLQVPMEPFDYPQNDPGPQTLLTTLSPEQNAERLRWFMSRFGGYVGIANYMGARFVAHDASVGAVIRESGKRGLLFFDDGAARSVTAPLAAVANVAYARADVVIDATPTAAEVDAALTKLEAEARARGFAVGYASALPLSLEHIAGWAKALAARGLVLVPISAVANKPKSS